MAYEVERRRIYGASDRYCNGSGISVIIENREEAERQFDSFVKNDAGYPAAVYMTNLRTMEVVKQHGPNKRTVEAAMLAAARRRAAKVAA